MTAPRKQQHTARRVSARLDDEHGVTDVSYWTVRDYVAKRRAQIAAEAGRVLAQVFVPQSHAPGAEGGWFRRTHLVPVPQVASLAELNARLERYDRADDHRRIGNRVRTVGQDFALEAPPMRSLPFEPFEAGLVLTPRVDRDARITMRQCLNSVPAKLIGQRVRVILRADELVAIAGRREVARHERSTVRGQQRCCWTTI